MYSTKMAAVLMAITELEGQERNDFREEMFEVEMLCLLQ